MKFQLLQNFIDASNHCQELDILDQIYSRTLMLLDFDQFAHSYYDSVKPTGPYKHDFATDTLAEWHKHFITQNYEQIDEIGSRVRSSIIPIVWDLHKEHKTTNDKQKILITDALDYKLYTGISIPFHDAKHNTSVLVVHDKNICRRFQIDPDLQFILQQLGLYYHHRISTLLRPIQCKKLLTPRELECLKLTEQYKTAKQIARILNITPRTVGYHVENVLKKLNAKNKFEAISKLNST